jgi:hypothetical protein
MPMMRAQGTDGVAARVPGEILDAASPTIWMAWTTAKGSIVSSSRSARWRPAMNRCAVCPASIMWRIRIASSGVKLRLRGAHHLVPEIAAQVARGAEVDLAPAQKLREVDLDLGHRQQAGRGARFELDEQINVAVGPVGT